MLQKKFMLLSQLYQDTKFGIYLKKKKKKTQLLYFTIHQSNKFCAFHLLDLNTKNIKVLLYIIYYHIHISVDAIATM